MKKVIKIFIVVFAIIGLSASLFYFLDFIIGNSQGGIIVNQNNTDNNNINDRLNLHYSLPEKIYNTDNLILKIMFDEDNIKLERSYYSSNTYINVLVHNIVTDSSKLLFNIPVEIAEIDYPSSKENIQNYIFYRCRINDSNNDGRINGLDNDVLFVSDLNGNYLEQVTPDSLSLIEYKLFRESNILFMNLNKGKGISHQNKEQKLMCYNLINHTCINRNNLDLLLAKSKRIVKQTKQ